MFQNKTEREDIAAMLMRLRALGIEDNRLLKVLESIPRGRFVSPEYAKSAYGSQIIPIDCGGFCESIDQLARIFQFLDINENHKVLEVGCGSGYSSALLSQLAERVLTVDRYKTHVEFARQRYEELGFSNVFAKQLDGATGVDGEGAFDRIFVSASFKAMPRQFVENLSTGGIMIAPLSLGNGRAKLMRLTKIGSRFEREDLFEIHDNPIVEGLAAAL